MKFIGYTSVICLSVLCVANDANAVNMTSQIQRLVREKQEKVSKLEECDGKRKGFMIAGISTIGLTAVGVGVNIAQASKSNKLSAQIEEKNMELEKQQAKIVEINSEISQRNNEKKRAECESDGLHVYVNGVCRDRMQYECEQLGKMWENGVCKDKPATPIQNTPTAPTPTSDNAAIIRCIEEIEHTLAFGFDDGKVVLYTKDGYMIPADKASQFSKNWDYSKFTVDADEMQATRSYNSANGVQEHEKDACEALNRLKNYLSTVNKSTLKHVEDFGAAEYITTQRNNTAAGNENTPTDRPTYYRNMDDLAKALDEECRNSGGTGRDADGDCQCPDDMKQTEDKRRCVAAQSETPQNQNAIDWSILENPTQDYGITKDKFCKDLNGNSYIGMSIALANYRNNPDMLNATIQNGAGHGYQCRQLGGSWAVTREVYGRYWKCEIDKSKCAQDDIINTSSISRQGQPVVEMENDLPESTLISSNQNTPDWTILENPRQDYGITQEEFCKHLYVSRGDDIGGSIVLANYSDDPNMLNAAIQHGAGHGYQCRQLGGMWIVTQETYGRYWKCKIKKSKCTPMMLEE